MADGAPASATIGEYDVASSSVVVVNGAVTIAYQASVIHVGYSYNGLLRTMNLHPQMQTGETSAKKKNVNALGVEFLNSAGARYGTNLYNMQPIPFGDPSNLMGRPVPLFSGVKRVPVEDSSDFDKHIYIQQTLPLPCFVAGIFPFVDVDEE